MNGLLSGILKKSLIPSITASRAVVTSSVVRLKQIELTKDDQKQAITIQGKFLSSDREPALVKELTECKNEGKRFCPECTLGLEIKHTDVLILSQYVRPDGCMMPRRVTGLCYRMQKRITYMVAMAQKAGLMINLTPTKCNKDPRRRFGFKKFNRYFDEDTIRLPKSCQ